MTAVPTMFFTADIASLLKIPEWRVVKFATGHEYQITPSHSDAAGSGTRRVYDLEDVCKIALALRLLDAGLSSKAIGRILRGLHRREPLSKRLEAKRTEFSSQYLVVFRTPKPRQGQYWSGRRQDAFFVSSLTEVKPQEHPKHDLLLVSVGPTFRVVKHRLGKWQREKGK